MNDEIKEILRDLEFASGVFDYTITPDRCTFLKDYITNLQQRSVDIGEYNTLVNKYNEIFKENKNLKSQLKGTTHCCDEEEHKKLQQENERLNSQLDFIGEQNKYIDRLEKEYKNKVDEIGKLTSKIYKASKYIKEHQRKDGFLNLNEWQARDLLNILPNGSDSQ